MDWKEKLCKMASEIKSRDDFVVVHHYDADGCSSGAIMYAALSRAKKKVKKIWVKQLYRETIEQIKGLGENYVFVDFGSGQLQYLAEEFKDRLFVFDHHQKTDFFHKNHFSPFDYGINGGNEISASGIAFLFAMEMDEKNADLAPLALVGAVGDVQDFNGKLVGLNEKIAKMGADAGFVKIENDLKLYGRISRPLTQFLLFSSSPIIPQLTANEENVKKFLMQTGIKLNHGEIWRTYSDLDIDEKKTLATALILHMQSYGVPEWKIAELFGEVYLFPKEDKKSPLSEAKEFSTLLNSCGRHGEAEVATDVCLGDRGEKYAQAMMLMAEHRRQLREGIEFVSRSGVLEEESFYFFDAGTKIKESIVGIIAGMLYGSVVEDAAKPIIAIAQNEDGSLKISGRATKDLVHRGINLGIAFREICADLADGSEGGGHSIAAGVKISAEKKEVFLRMLNTKLKEQLHGKKA